MLPWKTKRHSGSYPPPRVLGRTRDFEDDPVRALLRPSLRTGFVGSRGVGP